MESKNCLETWKTPLTHAVGSVEHTQNLATIYRIHPDPIFYHFLHGFLTLFPTV